MVNYNSMVISICVDLQLYGHIVGYRHIGAYLRLQYLLSITGFGAWVMGPLRFIVLIYLYQSRRKLRNTLYYSVRISPERCHGEDQLEALPG